MRVGEISLRRLFSLGLSFSVLLFSLYGEEKEDRPAQDIPDAIVQKVDPSVVAIQHERAGGSGFIVSKDGYILSNGHVVRGTDKEDPTEPAKSITVILNDERKYPAKVLGFCMDPDVALLKIECETPLTPVEFGNSLAAQIGQKVFAVGTPHGLKRTFSSGILSNVDRTDLNTFTKVFQTDAAINPGNSGGPLFDRNGKVLGLNTYGSRGANNLGFTIPIHVAKELYEDILKHGRFIRSEVPVFFGRELYDELRVALGVDNGILVDYVMEKTPAEKTGLRAGDVITAFNGKPVIARTKAELKDFIWDFSVLEPGTPVKFTISRKEGKGRKTVEVKTKTFEAEPLLAMGRSPGELMTEKYDALGLSFQRLVRLHRIYHRLQDDPGVLVMGADKGSPANKAGLSKYDIITHVGGEAVSDVASFRRHLEKRLMDGERYIDLKIRRRQQVIHTAIAPYYDLKKKQIAIVVPPGNSRNLGLVIHELIAQGADLTLASVGGKVDLGSLTAVSQAKINDLKSESLDMLLLLGGERATELWEHEALQEVIREMQAEEKKLAAIGASVITLVKAAPELLKKKMTTSKEHSGEALRLKAQYTGSNVEKESGLFTTTGIDRQVIREFLAALGKSG